ncbi:MAG: alkaline phosphatase family protein [Actinobacteria bacterium]|nr:alkaline phosphatase family protein [Actinomycetota bacterium]
MQPKKPVVYTIIDGMSVEALEQTIHAGDAPALSFIKEHAGYVRDSVAVFPTITPAATASLVTGATPAEHRIPGMCWYDRETNRFVNYGQSPRAAVVEGIGQVVEDALTNMNCKHLSKDVSTIHETLDKLGVVTASINFMCFRGPYTHELKPNILEKLILRNKLPDSLPGPKEHYFADVIKGPADACSDGLPKRGLTKRIQATDGYAACVTRGLLAKKAAGMIVFYLHENDHHSHNKGPSVQIESLAKADEHVAYVLDTFGSWEATLDQVEFVVTADHSQSPISDREDHILDLTEVLGDFSNVKPERGKEHFEGRDVACAGNGRVAFFYLNEDRRIPLLNPVAATLLNAEGIDQVMWRDDDEYVVKSDRGTLRFWEGGSSPVVDERDNKWSFSGELGVLSGVTEEGRMRTPEYPLAMWRIKNALDLDRMGDIVATMKLTYECKDLAGGDHRGGGDHASLHVQDSIIPFMSTLEDPPLRPTSVDVVPHIVRHFER